ITLDVTKEFAGSISEGERIALRHPEGMVLAIMTVTDIWEPDRTEEAEAVFGTQNDEHPGVFTLLHQTNPVYIGGTLEGIELPQLSPMGRYDAVVRCLFHRLPPCPRKVSLTPDPFNSEPVRAHSVVFSSPPRCPQKLRG
ncbi:MAG TPA: hypothetical protein ENF77_06110, partial [Candidatus Acetothermia bacterium]|nr:hypothetical protein [Candidatus Acetothermia bacterium]